MIQSSKYIGLDVHSSHINVAVAPDVGQPQSIGKIQPTAAAIKRLAGRLAEDGYSLCFGYEAGPCGYGIYRQLKALGHACKVMAPSRLAKAPGNRVKTDRLDAMFLAKALRDGNYSAVWVPDPAHEALRDLVRARADAKHDQRVARQRINSFLLRHSQHYQAGSRWTRRHYEWLADRRFDLTPQRLAFEHYLLQEQHHTAAVEQLEQQMRHEAQDWSLHHLARSMQAFRGFQDVGSITYIAELGDLTRFDNARQLMGYLGLIPSEDSTGKRVRRGSITKTGNAAARHVLTQAAWAYRHAPKRSRAMAKRSYEVSPAVQDIAWKAQVRLHRKYKHMTGRLNKSSANAATAVTRELCGFTWAAAQTVMASGAGSPDENPRRGY